MIQRTAAVLTASAGEVPPEVAKRRADSSLFEINMRTFYRRLLDRQVASGLAASSDASQVQLTKIIRDAEAALAGLAREAVHANVVISAPTPARHEELAQAKRAALDKLIPAFHPRPLPNDLAVPAKCTVDQLRSHRGYVEACDAVVDSLVIDAARLVEYGLLGKRLHDSTAPVNHGAYSYVLRRVQESVEATSTEKEVGFDKNLPIGQRRTVQRTTQTQNRQKHVSEEHVHHLENMSLSPFKTFSKPLPPWAVPLRKAVPGWALPEIQVIEGRIVGEEKSILDEFTHTWETTTIAIEKLSPAIVLGDLVLAGWSNQDLPTDDGISPWIIVGGIGLLACAAVVLVPGLGALVGRGTLAALKTAGRAAVNS